MDRDGSGSITVAELFKLAFPLVDSRTLQEMVVLTMPRGPINRGHLLNPAPGNAVSLSSFGPPPPQKALSSAMKAEIEAVFDALDENGA